MSSSCVCDKCCKDLHPVRESLKSVISKVREKYFWYEIDIINMGSPTYVICFNSIHGCFFGSLQVMSDSDTGTIRGSKNTFCLFVCPRFGSQCGPWPTLVLFNTLLCNLWLFEFLSDIQNHCMLKENSNGLSRRFFRSNFKVHISLVNFLYSNVLFSNHSKMVAGRSHF